jgi:hypothetical protein
MPAWAYAHSRRRDDGASVQNFSDAPGKPFELINATAVARGAWFGPIGWPRLREARVQRR